MRLLLGLLASAGILVGPISEASYADEIYPSRSITLVVPVPPGGAAAPHVTVLLNFFDELRRRVPVR